jgi:hypothetical protein
VRRTVLRSVFAGLLVGLSLGLAAGVVSAHTSPIHPYHYSVGSCDTWLTHYPYPNPALPITMGIADTKRQDCTSPATTVGVRLQWQYRYGGHGTSWTTWRYETDNWVVRLGPGSATNNNPIASSHYYRTAGGTYVTASLNF